MKLELTMSLDGAAFDNGPGPLEAARILREAADTLEAGWDVDQVHRLRDVNGNRVGYYVVSEED